MAKVDIQQTDTGGYLKIRKLAIDLEFNIKPPHPDSSSSSNSSSSTYSEGLVP
jgi:hypothetical protein